jgi:cytochrome P450
MSFAPEDLLTDAFAFDPHPVYARMRACSPVLWHAPTASWYVTGYPEVVALLRNPALSARSAEGYTRRLTGAARTAGDRVEEFFDRWMVFSDPPAQSRLRASAAALCSPRAAERRGAAAADTAQALLNALDALDADGADLAGGFATPLATAMTCDFLDIPEADRAQLGAWSHALMGYLTTQWAEPEPTLAADLALAELTGYLGALVAARPRDGSAPCLDMLAGVNPGDVPALFAQLLTGGIEPVASCLATAVVQTAEAPPGGADAAQADPAAEVEEALRFDAPFHFVPRTAAADLDFCGQRLRTGERVVLVVAAANRDPRVHAEPDRFLPGRPMPRPHLAFGAGSHYCLGAPLARAVLRAGLAAVQAWLRAGAHRTLTPEREPRVGATAWRRVSLTA